MRSKVWLIHYSIGGTTHDRKAYKPPTVLGASVSFTEDVSRFRVCLMNVPCEITETEEEDGSR